MSHISPTPATESELADHEVLDAVGAAVIVTDGSGRIVQWNSATTRMFGWLGEEGPRRLVQGLLASRASGRPDRSRKQGSARVVPLAFPDGSVAHYVVERSEIQEPRGMLTVWTVTEVDLDLPPVHHIPLPRDPGLSERRAARDDHRDVLIDLDRALASCRTTADVLQTVPAALVPRVAAWCGVFLTADTDADADDIESTFQGSPGPTESTIGHLAHSLYSDAAGSVPRAVLSLVRDGRFVQVDLTEPDAGAAHGFDPPTVTVLRSCGVRHSVVIPLSSGGRPFGALHLLLGERSGPISEETSWHWQIAVRIAALLGPLRESDRNQDLAVIFQESLLPDDFPAIPGFEVAARHRTGTFEVDLGGDFYDVVTTAEDCWALLIGDVCGRGPAAAAQTGRLRHSFRMSAWHADTPPEILHWLDRALRTAADGVLSTAAVASLERSVADGSCTLTCALGGHPQPLVCRADGTVEFFGKHGMMLGTDLDLIVEPVSTDLGPGDAVLFYTDGITDAPPPNQLSQRRLHGLVERAWQGCPSAEVLLDRVLAEADALLSLDKRTDDIALVALRRSS